MPLTEAADNVAGTGAANPTFAIGGSAFLKPWFDAYRAEAPGGSLTVAAGDSVGRDAADLGVLRRQARRSRS